MSRTGLICQYACFVTIAFWISETSAQSVFDGRIEGSLGLVKAVAMSGKCGIIDNDTELKALRTLNTTMRRQQAEAHLSNADSQIGARFDAAFAEGKAVSLERCDRFKSHPEEARRQTEIVEMLAHGDAKKPG